MADVNNEYNIHVMVQWSIVIYVKGDWEVCKSPNKDKDFMYI